MTARRTCTLTALVALVIPTWLSCGGAHTAADVAAHAEACGVLFDEFDYSSAEDARLHANGWIVRDGGGGPGVNGARWSPANLSFDNVDGESTAVLTASTDGTPAGTTQVELGQAELRFREGTYAARIRFSDEPTSGADGDEVNQTFYALGPLRFDNDPLYSELDFAEYLPNGGWGTDTATLFVTSYHTYATEPVFTAKNRSDSIPGSLAGWHVVAATVAGGRIVYSIDGTTVAEHDGGGEFDVYPPHRHGARLQPLVHRRRHPLGRAVHLPATRGLGVLRGVRGDLV